MTIKEYIERYFKIKTKSQGLIPFTFNGAQKKFYEVFKKDFGKKPPRYIILKARQLGFSTLTEALITCLVTTNHFKNGLIVAHESEATNNLYEMSKRYIDNLPDVLRPAQKYNNARRLVFNNETNTGLDSSIRVMTAGDGARSSTFNYLHLSEVAFWNDPETAMTALKQTVPDDNETLIIIESTANGFNYFYNEWQRAVNGESDYTPLFFPWFEEPNYQRPYTGFALTEYEKSIKSAFHLTNEQLAWRRWCISNNCDGDEQRFRQEYPITPEEAFITSGDNVFNTEIIQNHIKKVKKSIKQGFFEYDYDGLRITNIRWVDDPKGLIKIYEEPKLYAYFDQINNRYISINEYDKYPNKANLKPFYEYTALAGDTAGEGEDYFANHVLSREGKQLAVLHKQIDEDLYTKQTYCLGIYYNSMIGIEVNFSTYPTMELQRLNYPLMYMREKYDQILNDVSLKYGFKTTSLTRPVIISQLVQIMREDIELINDRATLQEALSFVRIKGKPQAAEGAHDDLIMSLAIGYEILKQLPPNPSLYVKKKKTRNELQEFLGYGD